jgi:Bardet-Biedl syndrome 1 protein
MVIIVISPNHVVFVYCYCYVYCCCYQDPVVGMKFGQFGREDGSLILIGQTGSLTVKILKRTAILEVKESRTGG